MSETSNRAPIANLRPGNRHATPEQRAAFYLALEKGHSVSECARMVGVARNTGSEWARQAKVRKAEQQARAGLIATKTQVAAELTRLGLEQADVAPRDKVNALTAVSKVMGYDAPIRSEQVIIHGSVAQWIEAQRIAASASAELPTQPASLQLPGASQQPAIDIASVALPAGATKGEK